MSEILTLENISKYYTSAQSIVMGLQNVSLSFSPGEFVAVTGESGSGKSTLAGVMAGLLPYEGGEMLLNGKPTSHYGQSDWEQYRSRHISFVSQNYDILSGCSVLGNVVSALVLTGMDAGAAATRAEEILAQVELSDKKKRRAAKLSSGQKQRLSIARALAKPTPILIADEPTGNLDKENSAKVVKLLAQAAKERLVIMVTHDFDEAEELVTRKITVRGGMVESDVRLREPEKATPREPVKKGEGRNLSLYTAKLQMGSRPVWTVAMVFFFTLTAFAMFAFLGTFVVNLDDNFTRVYDDAAFLNGSPTRIVVARGDKGDFTKEDFAALSAVPYVERVECYGFLTDINYYYREGVDYKLHYQSVLGQDKSPTGDVKENFTMNETGLYLQTVPYQAGKGHFLTAGVLPETMYEAVAVGDESLIGSKITVYIRNRKLWPEGSYIKVPVTVVGVTDVGEHLYFAEQLGRVLTGENLDIETAWRGSELGSIFTGNSMAGAVVAPFYGEPAPSIHYKGEPGFSGHFLCTPNIESILLNTIVREHQLTGQGDMDQWGEYFDLECLFFNYKEPENSIRLKPYGTHDSNYNLYMLVSPEDFERIVPKENGGIASLVISDYAYTDRVLDALKALGYPAISPYRVGSTRQDADLAAQRLATLKICILASLSVFLLQVLLLRVMFGMQTKEFRLLANLGLPCRTAKASIVWQIFVLTVLGQVTAAAAIALTAGLGAGRVRDILKYLPPDKILLFSLLHLATGLLAFLWIQHFIGAQVYPSSARDVDLKMEEEPGL